MIDLQETFLFLKVKLSMWNVAFEAADDAMFAKNTMHSLFLNRDFFYNIEQIYTSSRVYAHKAFISNEFSDTKGTKISICECQDYRYEKVPASFGDEHFISRKAKTNKEICSYGKLTNDVFKCNKILLTNVKIRLRLVRFRPNFYLITNQNKKFSCSILRSVSKNMLYLMDRINAFMKTSSTTLP